MANGIDSSGTDFYLLPTTTTATTIAECDTAIATGKRIVTLKSFGDIGSTRAVTEDKFISNDEPQKSMGSKSFGNVAVECLFNPLDTEGQTDLTTMYEDKTARMLLIANTDGTYTKLIVKCSSVMKTYATDTFVAYKATIEINSEKVEIIA